MNDVYLNGPINYMKLYNKEENKYLYVFMDWHANIEYQQKCDSLHSIDIDKYIFHILEEAKINIDFFLEVYPTDINDNTENSRINHKYIHTLMEKFKKLYNNLKIKKKKNIRLHYIDIRAYTFYENISNSINSCINNFKLADSYNMNLLINNIDFIFNNIYYLFDIITKIKNKEKNIEDKYKIKINLIKKRAEIDMNLSYKEIDDNATFQILKKILTKYDNNKNKENINNLFQIKYIDTLSYLISNINKFLINLKDIQKLVNYYYNEKKIVIEKSKLNIINEKSYYLIPNEKNIRMEIINELEIIYTIILSLGLILVDCFFLRRFVDKSYIKNALVYTGASHSCVYIWFLIKFYNYKITEYDYLKNITVDKLYEIILSTNNPFDIEEYLFPENFKQCVHLKNKLFKK